MIRRFFIIINLIVGINIMVQRSDNLQAAGCNNWRKDVLLYPTEKKSARTAILIIAPPKIGKSDVELRWELGKKIWEQYMNSHPNADCYFIQGSCFKKGSSETAWIEGNTIYVGDIWYGKYGNDRLLHKTVKALELLLSDYTHFFRTNLNTFFSLKKLNDYVETHHASMFTTPIWQGSWHAIGYSILFTQDVAAHLCSEYERLDAAGEELISCYYSDDGAITALATGVWPHNKPHPFRCCPSLPFATRQLMSRASLYSQRFMQYGLILSPIPSLEVAIRSCENASADVILYRIKNGLSLKEIAQLYEYLFRKHYPELPSIDMVAYLNQLYS